VRFLWKVDGILFSSKQLKGLNSLVLIPYFPEIKGSNFFEGGHEKRQVVA